MQHNLANAQIILLLVSADFLASDELVAHGSGPGYCPASCWHCAGYSHYSAALRLAKRPLWQADPVTQSRG